MLYNLSDNWSASGTDLEEYRNLVREITDKTHFITAMGDDLKFYYRLYHPAVRGGYKFIQISPELLMNYENSLCGYKTDLEQAPPEQKVGFVSGSKLNRSLTDESINACGYIMSLNGKTAYVAGTARATLCMRADLTGERTARNSMYLTQAICESIGATDREMTVITREHEGDTKIFAFMSSKYEPIPMTIIPETADLMEKGGKIGKGIVTGWFMDQTFTSLNMEFPDAADDLTAMKDLSVPIIPGLQICSSDTGASSLTVRGTYRKSGYSHHVIMDEYTHKHAGTVTPEEILKAVDDVIMSGIRKLPEALADKMTRVIGSGKTGTKKERRANKNAVMDVLKNSMSALGIKKELGIKRTNELLECLYAEIDPFVIYTEYDIAMTFMGLPDRLEGLSRDMMTRIAKLCGKAPFKKLAGKHEPVLTVLPEGA